MLEAYYQASQIYRNMKKGRLESLNPKQTMGGGIKTRPIRRLPLARQTKFELKYHNEFFFLYVQNISQPSVLEVVFRIVYKIHFFEKKCH